MNRRRSLIVAAYVLVAGTAALVWLAARLAHRADAWTPAASTGERITLRFFRDPPSVPTFAVRDLEGRPVSSADWHGKVTILNFWATWCAPCRAEIPALIALQEKYRGRVQVIGISEDEGPPDPVKRFAVKYRINYPIVMLTPEIERLFPGIDALPTSFVVDRDARIVQKHVGLLDAAMAEQEARALAGLPVNASIERVDRIQRAHLENSAQATNIPGVDLAVLKQEQRTYALQKLNTDACTCGCDLTLAKCRIDDPTCSVSLPLARQIVTAVQENGAR